MPQMPPIPFESSVHGFAAPMSDEAGVIRRVAVLPMIDHCKQADQAEMLRSAIAHQLRRKGTFEVLSPQKLGLAPCISPDLAQSAFAETMLVEMANTLRVDGVIIVHATEIRPFEPIRVALTLHLVDARDAITVATVDGVWDSDDLATNAAAANYFTGKSVDWNLATEVNLVSPSRFYDFIGYDIAARLDRQLFPNRAPQTVTLNCQTSEGKTASSTDLNTLEDAAPPPSTLSPQPTFSPLKEDGPGGVIEELPQQALPQTNSASGNMPRAGEAGPMFGRPVRLSRFAATRAG